MSTTAHTPLISVIIPVYNTAKYLRLCLDSICKQTYKNLEIICVDDGSTDNSGEILKEYANRDSRFIVLSQENAGQSVARNKALDIARGEWITGVDSDDWIDADTYEYCMNALRKSDAKLAMYGGEAYNATRKVVLYREVYPKGEIKPSPQFIAKTANWFPNKIWHRSLIQDEHHRFPEGMWWEDVVFFNRIAPYLDKILCLTAIKYHYMRYDGGTSTMDIAHNYHPKYMDKIKAVEIILDYFSSHPLPEHMKMTGALILQKMFQHVTDQVKIETQQNAWEMMRLLVEKHNLLDDIRALPNLALQYNIPPCAVNALNKLFMQRTRYIPPQRDINLLTNYSRLVRKYRICQLKAFFSCGQRKAKYIAKGVKLKKLIREARQLRRKTWDNLLNS